MAQARAGFEMLDGVLADGRDYLCGKRFSLADIRFYTLYSFFAANDAEHAVGPQHTHLLRYIARIRRRPAAAGIGRRQQRARL